MKPKVSKLPNFVPGDLLAWMLGDEEERLVVQAIRLLQMVYGDDQPLPLDEILAAMKPEPRAAQDRGDSTQDGQKEGEKRDPLAQCPGMSLRTLKRVLARLKGLGWVAGARVSAKGRVGGAPMGYVLTLPSMPWKEAQRLLDARLERLRAARPGQDPGATVAPGSPLPEGQGGTQVPPTQVPPGPLTPPHPGATVAPANIKSIKKEINTISVADATPMQLFGAFVEEWTAWTGKGYIKGPGDLKQFKGLAAQGVTVAQVREKTRAFVRDKDSFGREKNWSVWLLMRRWNEIRTTAPAGPCTHKRTKVMEVEMGLGVSRYKCLDCGHEAWR